MPAVHPTRRQLEASTAILIAIVLLAAVFVIMPQPAQGAFHGNMGSFIDSVGDEDFVPVLEDAPAGSEFCFGYIEDSSEPGDPEHYAWMFHISTAAGGCADAQSPSTQGTWLITAFGGSTSGAQKWLTSGDTQYTNTDFDGLEAVTSAAEWLCYGESDGIDGYSIGDTVYIKEDFTAAPSQTLEVDDLRISAVKSTTLTPFSESVGIVESSDNDFKRGGESSASPPTADPSRLPVNRDLDCGGFEIKMLNLGSLDDVSKNDVFYLTHEDLANDETVYPGMLRLTSISGISGHGEKVISSNNEVKRTLELDPAFDLVVVDDGDPGAFDSKLAIQQDDHPAGDDTKVRMNDVYIKRNEGDSSSSPGTLVTHAPSGTQIGVGSSIDSRTALDDQIYYIDKSPTGVLDEDDPIYIKHPDNGGAGGVEVGDIRLSVPGESDGTSVENSDSDFLEHQGATGVFDFQLKLYSEKGDTRMPLKSVSNGKFVSATDVSIWDNATDNVYIASASTITDGLDARQVWDAGTGPVNEQITFDCSGPDGLGPDDDCGESLKSGILKTTGQKTAWQDGGEDDGDRLYWSDDNFLTVGDYRMGDGTETSNHIVATGPVLAGEADVLTGALFQSSGVTLFASVHEDFEHPTSQDIQIFPSFGDRWTHSTSDAVPNPQEITAFGIVRAELGDSAGISEDVYYLDFSGWGSASGAPCDFSSGRALRLLPFDEKDAGSFVLSGDNIERQSTRHCEATDPADFFGYIDNSPLGLDPDEFVYLNLPSTSDLGGSTGDTLSQWDSRITPVSHGSSSFSAGTQVVVGDGDFQSFSGDTLEGIGDAKILWWDANPNDRVDEDDALWLRMHTTTTDTTTFLDIRLNGPPASGGGNNGGSPSEPDDRPTASFTTSTDGRELSVDGSASSAVSGRNLDEYEWNFGDGEEVIGNQAILTHTYEEEGQYTVRLTVTDTQGDSRTTTSTVQTDGYVPPETPTETPDETATPTPTDNGTDDSDGEEEPTPGVALVGVLAVLATVLVVLRRRR